MLRTLHATQRHNKDTTYVTVNDRHIIEENLLSHDSCY